MEVGNIKPEDILSIQKVYVRVMSVSNLTEIGKSVIGVNEDVRALIV